MVVPSCCNGMLAIAWNWLTSCICILHFVFSSTQYKVVPSCSNGMWAFAWNWLTKCICICILYFVSCIFLHTIPGGALLLQWNLGNHVFFVFVFESVFCICIFLLTIPDGALLPEWNVGHCMELVDHHWFPFQPARAGLSLVWRQNLQLVAEILVDKPLPNLCICICICTCIFLHMMSGLVWSGLKICN